MVFVQVIVEFDATFENEEYFLSIVTLTVQLVFCVDLHRFQQGQDCEKECRVFLIEEPDSLDDLCMSM